MSFLEELKETYLASFPAHIEELENLLLELEKTSVDSEAFASLYRKVHSLKGSGGTYGFTIISTICHQFEDMLASIEQGEITLNSHMTNICFSYIDLLKDVFEKLKKDVDKFSDEEQRLSELKEQWLPKKSSVMLIERSALNVKIVAASLAEFSIQLSVENDGAKALQRLMHDKFDYIITAYEIGDLNGEALSAALKLSSGANRNTPILMMSSSHHENLPIAFSPDYVINKDEHLAQNLFNYFSSQRMALA